MEALEARCVPANLVTNGGFENPQEPSIGIEINAPSNIGGWTLDRNSVDLVTNYQTPEGRQFVFLSGGNAGSIYQDIATVPGTTYNLRFAMSGDPGKPGWPLIKHMDVDWGASVVDTPTFDITSNSQSNMGWIYHEDTVVATSNSMRLRFSSLDFDPTGPAVDDISLVPVATPDIAMQSAQLQGGNTVQFTYQTTGNPGPFQVGLYRSTDGITYSATDQIGSLQPFTPGPPNQTTIGSFPPFATPLAPDPTKPFLVVVADPPSAGKPKGDIIETDDTDPATNSNGNNAAPIQLPDLNPTFLNPNPAAPDLLHKLIYRGQTLSVPLFMKNLGGNAAGDITIEYYLSTNQNADLNGFNTLLIPVISRTISIPAGGVANATESVFVPSDLAKGTYWLKAKIIPTDANQDNNLGNNIAVSEPLTACSDTNSMTGDRAALYEGAVTIAKDPNHTVNADTVKAFIKQNEKFDAVATNEPNGNLEIGYGFDLTTDGKPHDKENVKKAIAMFSLKNLQGKPATYDNLLAKKVNLNQPGGLEFADELFQLGFKEAEKAVADEINVSLTPNQYKALVDLAYNIGQGKGDKGLHGFKNMIRDIEHGDFACAGFELIDSRRTDQLRVGSRDRLIADFLLLVSGQEEKL